MEDAVAAPNVPTTSKYLDTLIELKNFSSKKPPPLYISNLQKSLETKRASDESASPASPKPFLDDFSTLQPGARRGLLTRFWPGIASPSLEAPLRAIAEGSSEVRDMARLRMYDLNPDAARKIVERVGRLDFVQTSFDPPHSLLLLPDKAIPELDDGRRTA